MALIQCPECKKEVSDTAARCPHCGFSPLKRGPLRFFGKLLLLVVGLFALVFAVFFFRTIVQPNAHEYSRAKEEIRAQVASDISIEIEEPSLRLNDPGGERYYVCGRATLNRPGTGPLALHNSSQRFITTLWRGKTGGITEFDGSSRPEAKAEFQRRWDRTCLQAVR